MAISDPQKALAYLVKSYNQLPTKSPVAINKIRDLQELPHHKLLYVTGVNAGTLKSLMRAGHISGELYAEGLVADLRVHPKGLQASLEGFLQRGGTGAVPPKLGDKFDAATLKGYADTGLGQFIRDANAALAKRGLQIQGATGAGLVQSPRGGAKTGAVSRYVITAKNTETSMVKTAASHPVEPFWADRLNGIVSKRALEDMMVLVEAGKITPRKAAIKVLAGTVKENEAPNLEGMFERAWLKVKAARRAAKKASIAASAVPAVRASSRRVRYLRRKYGPKVAAQPPKVGTEVQGMTGKRCTVKGYKAGRALLSDGRNLSLEQLTRDYGWSGKCSIACALPSRADSWLGNMLDAAGATVDKRNPDLWRWDDGGKKGWYELLKGQGYHDGKPFKTQRQLAKLLGVAELSIACAETGSKFRILWPYSFADGTSDQKTLRRVVSLLRPHGKVREAPNTWDGSKMAEVQFVSSKPMTETEVEAVAKQAGGEAAKAEAYDLSGKSLSTVKLGISAADPALVSALKAAGFKPMTPTREDRHYGNERVEWHSRDDSGQLLWLVPDGSSWELKYVPKSDGQYKSIKGSGPAALAKAVESVKGGWKEKKASVRASNARTPFKFKSTQAKHAFVRQVQLKSLGHVMVNPNDLLVYILDGDKEAIAGLARKMGGVQGVGASFRASNGQQPPTGKFSMEFPDESSARSFAQSAMGVDGARVTCSGKSVSVTYPASHARKVIAAAHASHGKAVAAATKPLGSALGSMVTAPDASSAKKLVVLAKGHGIEARWRGDSTVSVAPDKVKALVGLADSVGIGVTAKMSAIKAAAGEAPIVNQVHMAISRMGYGLGRPRLSGNSLVYDTPDPEDAEMIAEDVPAVLAKIQIKVAAKAQGRKLVVTIIDDLKASFRGDGSLTHVVVDKATGKAVSKPQPDAQVARGVLGKLLKKNPDKKYAIVWLKPDGTPDMGRVSWSMSKRLLARA